MKPQVDYTLYLVTDSTPAILGSKDLVEVVKEALLGGVTVVQYREKTSDTGDLISTAKKLHQVCKQHNVPLLINDRVDVALAVGCEGVHIGQDDMNAAEARKLLGDDKIIGVTASSMDEARKAVEDGADYLGIGTLYATNTKKNTKDIIGIKGVRQILHYLDTLNKASKKIKTVCIGGINASNIQLVTYQLKAPSPKTPNPKTIDGVAIVSAIIGAANPKDASSDLRTLLKIPPPFTARSQAPFFWHENEQDEITHIRSSTLKALLTVREKSPLSHNMTNLVVQNFAASVALAIGASPIMSNNGDEAADLAKLGGALVINMGTATPEALINHRKSIIAYNAASGPIVLDPVGAGATTARKEALAFLMASGYFDLIKGNEREIMAVARASGFVLDDSTQQRGVDSGTSLFSLPQKAYIVSRIAARERNVVLMTGAVDVISDGFRTYAISNGHKYLGMITGSGCTLGTTLSAYMAARPQDKLLAAVAGILHFEIAAEYAARREDVKGPGTFVPAFVDELWARGEEVDSENANAKGDLENVEWLKGVKVECIKQIPDEGLLREI